LTLHVVERVVLLAVHIDFCGTGERPKCPHIAFVAERSGFVIPTASNATLRCSQSSDNE
jgi:predicted metal-binding protein